MATTAETPILIVGGGPVGLALAADLGWRGVPCLADRAGRRPRRPSARLRHQCPLDGVHAPLGRCRRRARRRQRRRTFRTPRSIAPASPASRSPASSGPHHGGTRADHREPGAAAALQPDLARPDPARARRELRQRAVALPLALRGAARGAPTASSRPCTISRATSAGRSPPAISSTAAAATARSAARSASA